MKTFSHSVVVLGIAAAVSVGLVLSGCGEAGSTTGADHGDHDHAHGADGHDHDHDDGGQEHVSGGGVDTHGHEETREVGTVEIGGSTLRVAVGGALIAGGEAQVDVTVGGGETPTALRLWIGDRAATGTIKTKADGGGGGFHAHVEVPSNVDGMAVLWVEVEQADGERLAESLPIGG
ncbi:MAG: hypothetical protein CMJ31_02670 [Phycisphaerae bacterium]|nr:hypothetical protein [Phycisphaerae bacterium]